MKRLIEPVDLFAPLVCPDGTPMHEVLDEMNATAEFYAEQDERHAAAGWVVVGPGRYIHPEVDRHERENPMSEVDQRAFAALRGLL